MAEQKIFAGPRIRRIRTERNLTQSAMAEGLGISASYLNLIERNQRPLTVQLLLKLSSIYKIDPAELQGDGKGVVPALKEAFSDPLLVGELPGDQEMIDFAQSTPNAATAFLKLYTAYREQTARLSDLSGLASGGVALSTARLPLDELRDVLSRQPNYFEGIEGEADAFLKFLAPGDDLMTALKEWLKRDKGIVARILPVATMPNWRRRYDRHSQRLFISERLSSFDQLREIAIEACLQRMSVALSAAVEGLKLSSDEARRLARQELARYAAHALMMPYGRFLTAAIRARYDLDVLRARFNVSFEQAAYRLTTLQKSGEVGVPFFIQEADHAGNRIRALGAKGYPTSGFGNCPKLAIHTAFQQPGQIVNEAVEAVDGEVYLTIARTIDGPQGNFGERIRRTALLLCCPIVNAEKIIYADFLPPLAHRTSAISGKTFTTTLIGPGCRLCERVACLSRAEPPITRPLGLDEFTSPLSAYDFQ